MNNKSILTVIRNLYFNKLGILLLFLFILSLGIFYIAFKTDDIELKNILISIASSLLASNLFSVLYTLVTNSSFLDYCSEIIKNEIQKTNEAYVASKIFNPTQTKNYSFNKDLTLEFSNASKFMFRGVSGKRVAARLFYLNKKLEYVRLIIIHPEDSVSINKRANYKLNLLEKKKKKDIETEIKKDIYLSLINLYHLRYKCHLIEIVFQQGYSAARLEILDNAVYVSVYDNDYDGFVYYPSVIKFCNKTVFYKMYAAEYIREFEFSKKYGVISITSETSEKQFIEYLENSKINGITMDSLTSYEKMYEKMKAEYKQEFSGT